jgi:hypothetical protein
VPTVTLERWSEATDSDGVPLNRECDFLRGNVMETSTDPELPETCLPLIEDPALPSPIPPGERGLPVRVGDVLYLRRWSPGFVRNAHNLNHNFVGPTATTYRLPVRSIEPGTPLRDEERQFLADLLTANRSGEYPDTAPELGQFMQTREVDLWNAVVEGLSIRRIARGANREQPLVVTVRSAGVRAVFPEDWRDAFRDIEQWEISGIDVPFSTPFEAITNVGPSTAKNDSFYNNGGLAGEPRGASVVDFVSARLGGVTLRSRELPESGWSLLEWEKSGICGDTAEIHSIRLARTGQVLRVLRGADANNATHYVRVVLDRRQPARSIRRRGGATGPGFFTRLSWITRARTIGETDLDRLAPQDVQGIRWQGVGDETPRFRYSCTFHR